ncbi:hypothetical protein [Salinisphaera sp. G21_0]|uniref:hypothetical protein n=1 Tax=Salinisphaera sp. G21_0 TaxID=2821094 RepID=UPI001ADA82B1|nr:hypothetical protein [Salinisphaera sp. G21_0]MBO9483850.1 hypothetical protein [Salinisphaera sp. G21_0]
MDRIDLNDDVVTALEMPGTQLVIFGHTGTGKSTLLENLLFRVYEKQINTNCMKGMTFEEIVLDAFDQLGEFYVDEVVNAKKCSVNARMKLTYLSIQTQIQSNLESQDTEKQKRFLPPQLTPQGLGRLLGEAGYCWVLEDFHKIEGVEKEKLTQMMKVFVNMSDKYEDLKLIALGAVSTAREVVKTDREMRRRVTEIHVKLMSDEEIKKIISKGCKALNIIIPDDLQNDIVHYSNGLAAICHKLCYLMCDAAVIKSTLEESVEFNYSDLQDALKKYIKGEEDTIKDAFDRALKVNQVDNTIRVIAHHDQDGARLNELFNWAKDHQIKITKKKLESDLEQLQHENYGEIIKYDGNSDKFSFSDPFYRSFALAYYEERDKKNSKKVSEADLMKIFNQAFRSFSIHVASEDYILETREGEVPEEL